MPHNQDFRPDWVSAPGKTIAHILGERKISLADFARLTKQTPDQATDLLQGRAAITIGVARQLKQVLGASVEFWMARDFHYRQGTSTLQDSDEQWLAELPVRDMIKFGWLRPVPRPSDEMEACLRFFGVSSVPVWRQKYAELQEFVAFRTSRAFDSSPAAVAAWLRQGEIESEKISCNPWDPAGFENCLARIRPLTREKDPKRFGPKLQELCASCGVAVVIVRAPNGCRVSGATCFVSESKALLLLSFRYLSDDQFWFTFFHEAGHLLLHGKEGLFLEGIDAPDTVEERRANEFAEGILVPTELRTTMLQLPLNAHDVIRFARRAAISPGVVVGQLQHHGKIKRNQLNGLKRRFQWES